MGRKEDLIKELRKKIQEFNERWKGKFEIKPKIKKTVMDFELWDSKNNFPIYVRMYFKTTISDINYCINYLLPDFEQKAKDYDAGKVEHKRLVYNTAKAESGEEILKKMRDALKSGKTVTIIPLDDLGEPMAIVPISPLKEKDDKDE